MESNTKKELHIEKEETEDIFIDEERGNNTKSVFNETKEDGGYGEK